MARRLLNLLTVLSLLLCVAVAVLWVRSYDTADTVSAHWSRWDGDHYVSMRLAATTLNGRLTVGREAYPSVHTPDMGDTAHLRRPLSVMREWSSAAKLNDVGRGFLGISFGRGAASGGSVAWAAVPLWFVVVMSGLGPACYFRTAHRRRRRTRAGHCLRCGYSLRATPERCPECGAASRSSR